MHVPGISLMDRGGKPGPTGRQVLGSGAPHQLWPVSLRGLDPEKVFFLDGDGRIVSETFQKKAVCAAYEAGPHALGGYRAATGASYGSALQELAKLELECLGAPQLS